MHLCVGEYAGMVSCACIQRVGCMESSCCLNLAHCFLIFQAKMYHPDVNKEAGAKEKFAEVRFSSLFDYPAVALPMASHTDMLWYYVASYYLPLSKHVLSLSVLLSVRM